MEGSDMPTFQEVWENGGSAFSWRVGPGHQGNVAYGMVEGNQYEWVNGTLKVEESAAYLGGYLGFTVASGYEMTVQLSFNKKATWSIDNIEEADAFWDANEDNIRDDSDVEYSYTWNGLTYNHVLKLSMGAGDEVQMDIDNDYSAGIRDFKIKLGSKEYFLEGLVSEYDAIHTDVWVSLIDISPNPIPAGLPGGPPAQDEEDPDDPSDPDDPIPPATANSLGDTFLEPLMTDSINGFGFELWAYEKGYYVLEWKPEAANDDFEQYSYKRSPWGGFIPWITTQGAKDRAINKYNDLKAVAELWYDVQVVLLDNTFQNGSVGRPGAVGVGADGVLEDATFYGGVFRIYGFRLHNQTYILRCAWRAFGPNEDPGFMDSEWEWWYGTTFPDLASYEEALAQLEDYISNPIYPEDPDDPEDPGHEEDPQAICTKLDGESYSAENTTNHPLTVQIWTCTYNELNSNFVGTYLQVISSQESSPIVWSGQLSIDPQDPWSSADNQLAEARAQAQAYVDKWNEDFPPEVFTWMLHDTLALTPGVAKLEVLQSYESTYDRWTGDFEWRVSRWSLTGWDQVYQGSQAEAQAMYDALIAGDNVPIENAGLYAILGILGVAGIILLARRYS
jgi:hypothetical protein